nr:unnamed protein product [Digitaria exilis]
MELLARLLEFYCQAPNGPLVSRRQGPPSPPPWLGLLLLLPQPPPPLLTRSARLPLTLSARPAEQAEQEAAAVAQEIDALAARQREALQRAAAAHRGGPEDDVHSQDDDDDLNGAILRHEAAAAVGVQNIRSLVHPVLDLAANNYTRWRDQFLLAIGKYSLEDHVLLDAPAPNFPDWVRMEKTVKSWISGTISADLEETTMETDATARVIWLALETQFLGNRETRALHLDVEFRNFVQGDLSIADYCRRFKKMAEGLAALGEPVTDRTLVLNVIHGLNDRYRDVGRHLRRGRPFPTFTEAKAELELEELTLAHQATAPSSALVAGTTRTPPASSGGRPPNQRPPSSGSGSRHAAPKPKKGKKKPKSTSGGSSHKGDSGSSKGVATGASSTPWPSLQDPWAGSIQMWPGQRPPLAPIPGLPQQQALLAQAQAQAHAHAVAQQQALEQYPHAQAQYQAQLQAQQQAQKQQYLAQQQPANLPWTPTPPGFQNPSAAPASWDQQSLASSFSTVSLQQPPTNDWYFDSGASSHMTSDCRTLSPSSYSRCPSQSSIVVGNGALMPVTATGSAQLPVRGPYTLCVALPPQLFSVVPPLRSGTDVLVIPHGAPVKAVQCDNGKEFDNSSARTFFLTHGVRLRMSCPYTSPQNGKAERIIRSTNNIIRSLLFQASMPPTYWAKALATATYLLNIVPTKTLKFATPHHALHGTPPVYDHLRFFGCTCYPNLSATASHKLAPRSTRCVFLGYSPHHKGYRCLDTVSNRVLISRHVTFDETSFPFATDHPQPSTADYHSYFLQVQALSPPHSHVRPLHSHVRPPTSPAALSRCLCYLRRLPQAALDVRRLRLCPSRPQPPYSWLQPPGHRCFPPSHDCRTLQPPRPHGLNLPPATSSTPRVQARLHSPDRWRFSSARPCALTQGYCVPVPPVANQHGMTTRAKRSFRVLVLYHAAPLSPVPKTFRSALADPNWRAAMEEHDALLKNHTWDLVPRPPRANIVSGKWIFKHKFLSDGSLERYKARWVLRGFTQRPGIDYDETFSPVVKPATVRTVLSLALSRGWPVHQLDVKNAFLHGTLSETVYYAQPSGFEDPAHPDYVCRLNKSLYGLKQAPRAWYSRLAAFLLSLGFVEAKSDTSLFVYRRGSDLIYLLLYVDDIVLTASSSALLRRTISALQQEFSMKDLGQLHHFLGMSVQRSGSGLLSQRQYMLDILDRTGMADCKSCTTPVDTNPKLPADGPPVSDASDFRSLAGALQWLTFTRPDIAYAVQQVCLHMHDPREPHLTALKRILRYIRGTLDLGLLLRPSTTADLTVYIDADWAGCPDTRRSTSGYAVFLGSNLVSWSSKRQNTVSRSSPEAEYRAMANGVAEISWLRQLLMELHAPPRRASLVYCDNISAVYMSSNPVQHQRTKHIEIDLHFVRERVATGDVRVLHVPTSSQYADVFTKGLPSLVFTEFRSSLNVRQSDDQIAGAC